MLKRGPFLLFSFCEMTLAQGLFYAGKFMHDNACITFLQWCLPRLHLRWPGFRKVRRQACKRIRRRIRELGLSDTLAYQAYLDAHPEEWDVLDSLCRITISRFYRDRGVFDTVRDRILPTLAQRAQDTGRTTIRCWSAGCASGEEVYTLKIIWDQCIQHRFPDLELHLVATDASGHMLDRARTGVYPRGSLKEMPPQWIDVAFEPVGSDYRVRDIYRAGIDWITQDVRHAMPDGPFSLILCRNLVFTYFDEPLQRSCLTQLLERLHSDGFLVLGKHETVPTDTSLVVAWDGHNRIFERYLL